MGTIMHIYWRVQQDLNCLGEVIQFHDPSYIRSQKQWMKKNAAGIVMSEMICANNHYVAEGSSATEKDLKIGHLDLPEYSRN